MSIFNDFAELGWVEGYDIDASTLDDLSYLEDEPGYKTVAIWPVTPTTNRSKYRYSGTDGYCDIEGYGLHILTGNYAYSVQLEICTNSRGKYGEAFVEKVFDGFVYATGR